MKKLTNFFRNLLSMSPAEAKGVVVTFGIILLVILLMFGADMFFSQKQQNLVISSPKMLDSLTVLLDNQKPYYANQPNYGQKYDNYDSKKKTYKNFNFDPNIASVSQFEELGLPKFIAERIEKYRSKGGKFRKKEDLAKIYGVLPETYERLEPYISLPSAENESSHTPQAELIASNEQPTNLQAPTVVAKPAYKQPVKFDFNNCDTTVLKNIPGIGSGYAKRIIKFRDLLGGFVNAEQVKETFGLPPETFDELLKYGFVKMDVKKLKINTLAMSDFKHPYLRFFQAKAIIAYREQHGAFKSAEDLKQIKVLDEATIVKIEPYLEF
ncbi:helix-hairpin-helix domain-containing protein [Emticicia sp.]|uniref:helix-hairpin-helix domain-containing protein n=1 Tax=Emticicia sp. TaxID=1930953 RepID=UPI00375209B4